MVGIKFGPTEKSRFLGIFIILVKRMVKSSNILHKYTFTYQTYRILQSFIIGVTRNTGRPSMYTYTLQWPYTKCSGVCISGVAHCIRMKISFGILLLYRSSHATVTSWEHQNNKNLNPLKTFVWVIFLISFEKWNDFEFEFKQCMLYGHLIKSVCVDISITVWKP